MNDKQNWASTRFGSTVALAMVGLEANPIPFNESLRVAAGVWGYDLSNQNSVVAAAFAGIATIAIEGGAGVASADLLDTSMGKKATNFIRDKMAKLGLYDGLKTNPAIDASIALLGGSAVVTAVKHQQDPSRTRSENRNFALKSASGLTAFTMAETYAIANGLEHTSPASIALGAFAVGSLIGAVKWSKSKIKNNRVTYRLPTEGGTPHRLLPTSLEIENYSQKEDTISIQDAGKTIPVLVPAYRNHWINIPFLKERFGTDSIFLYMHPEINSEKTLQEVMQLIEEQIDNSGVVLYGVEVVGDVRHGDLSKHLAESGIIFSTDIFSSDGKQRHLQQYDGLFKIRGTGKEARFKGSGSIFEVYEAAVKRGDISHSPIEGPALIDVIDGEEAERLWGIYQKPFDKLSHTHPITVGYSKEEFTEMLSDEKTIKAVYRQNGKIVTMAFFINDLSYCDWLDARYYANKYPDATKTNNHWIFPGIVTDEYRRGERLSLPLMLLLSKVQAMTGSDAVISFECTEVSSKYIPRLARFAINNSKVAKVPGGFKKVSRLEYYAITR